MDQKTNEKLVEFLHRKEVLKELRKLAAAGQKSLVVEFESLLNFNVDLAKALLNSPADFLDNADKILTDITKLPGMRLRVKVLDRSIPIRKIRAENVGKFIQVDGILKRVGEVKPEIKEAVFKCLRCGEENRVQQIDEVYREPLFCENPNCGKKGPFKLIIESSEFRDWQSLVLQERPEELRGGQIPRWIDSIVRDDFVDKAVPGNRVILTGTLRVFQERQQRERKTTFRKVLFVSHIEVLQKGIEEAEILPEDEAKIKELAKDSWLRNLVIQSIAPSIYGYDPIKEAIALQLFGCNHTDLPDGGRIRGDTHILLTGDPGCLVADERVVLGNGAIVKIGELGSGHLQSLNQQVLTGQGYQRALATRFHIYRDQPILEVVTETGKSIKGTFNHPLLVSGQQQSRKFPCPPIRRWKRLDEIRPGDRVAVVPWIPCTITTPVKTGWRLLTRKRGPHPRCKLPSLLDEGVAAFLGYMLGDGWVRRYRIGFNINNEEEDLLPLLSSILKRKFGLDLKIQRVEQERSRIGQRETRRKHPLIRAEANSVDAAANLQFLREKRVPALVLKSGNRVVAEFLAWLFEADGCVFSKGRGKMAIQLKAKNIELLRDVQILLLRFGIHSRILGNNLAIRRADSIFRFSETISFRSKKKRAKLAELATDCKNRDPRKLRKRKRSERVIVVRPADRADVYDIEVPGPHRFIANGIISHNTAKSAILKWILNVAPRGLYTSGKKATGAGLCVAPDSLIWVRNGLGKISDLVENHFGGKPVSEITAVDVKIPQFSDRASAIMSLWKIPSPEKMVKIFTQYGKRIEVTPETRVMTTNGWKKAKELTTNDYIILPTNYGGWDSSYPSIVCFYPATLRIKNRAEIFGKISPKINDKRALAKDLGIPEDKMYYRWVHDDVRGAMTLEELRKICVRLKIDVDEILDGCEIKCQLRSGAYFKLPTRLSPELAYFVGLIAGDGSLSQKAHEANSTAVRFSNNDLKQEYIGLVRKLFGKKVEVTPPSEKRAQDFRFGNRALFDLLRGFGIQKPNKLFIPREITCNRKLTLAYLRGLFDTDGSVYDRKSHKSGTRGQIELTTVYREFAEQIQNLLFRLGIPAYLVEKKPKTCTGRNGRVIKSGKQYRIYITQNAAIDRFAELVGFSIPRKREKLEKIIGRGRASRYTEYVPAKVKKISFTPPKYQYVYDMTVEGSHSFVANGILVHNTAAAVKDEISGGWTLEAGALVIADGGLACVDEFDKMSDEDAGAILESMEQQSYHPRVEILLADGRKVRIGEFVDKMMAECKDRVVKGVDCEILPLIQNIQIFTQSRNSIEKVKINRVSRHISPKEFIGLTYSNGRSVVVTPEHPVFLWENGKVSALLAKEVVPGSFVPAPRIIPNSSVAVSLSEVDPGYHTEKDIKIPKILTPEIAKIVGFLVSEGWVYKPSYEIGFANSDHNLLDEMKRLMEDTFAITPGIQVRESDGVTRQRYVSARIYRWLEENFPEILVGALSKRAPAKIMGASREIAREFLKAAFLGDGSVESTSMCYRTSSRGLAEDYQDLLLKLSISSRIVTDKSSNSYKVYVAGDSFQKFLEEIAVQNDPRVEKIKQMVEKSKKVSRHHDVLPTGIAEDLINLYRVAGLSYDGYFREHINFSYGISRDVVLGRLDGLRKRFQFLEETLKLQDNLREIRQVFGYSQAQVAHLLSLKRGNIDYAERGGYSEGKRKKLLTDLISALSRKLREALRRIDFLEKLCDLRWLRVKKVESLPNSGTLTTSWVYDVTVEPTHNFISQGLMLHNTISVAKAGIVATLNTRTAILAAANPAHGRFDKNKLLTDQININPLMLSRFDLIFIMKDEPLAERDRTIAHHILELHREPTSVVKPPINPDLLRKMIIYARKYINPEFKNKEPLKAIEDFFVKWRSTAEGGTSPIPITLRQLEGIVRLAKANARMRLSNEVTIEDANRAINLVRLSLQEAGIDPESGKVDIDILMTGKSRSQRDKIDRVLEIIRELEEQYGGAAPIDEVKKLASSEGIKDRFVEQMLEEEKKRGHLYEPKLGMIARAVK